MFAEEVPLPLDIKYISFCSSVGMLLQLGQRFWVLFRNVVRSVIKFWHERMKCVSFSTVFWQDLQNLLSLSKGGLKCLPLSPALSIARQWSLRRNFERIRLCDLLVINER